MESLLTAACNYFGIVEHQFSLYEVDESTGNAINISEKEEGSKVLGYLERYAQFATSSLKKKTGAKEGDEKKDSKSKLLAKLYLGKHESHKKEEEKEMVEKIEDK